LSSYLTRWLLSPNRFEPDIFRGERGEGGAGGNNIDNDDYDKVIRL
jgi:hypothetical protein